MADGPFSGDRHRDPRSPQGRDQRSRTRRVLTVAGKILVTAVALGVFAATGFGWGAKLWIDDKFQQVSALDPGSADIVDRDKQYGDENFLLVGSDSRKGADAEDRAGNTTAVGGARTDTIMIAHLPANRSRAVVVSFPRDLEISRPDCTVWDDEAGEYTDEVSPAQDFAKINSAYQIGGPQCLTKVVQQITGLSINHFAAIDFSGFKEMVEAVDGVQVCVKAPIDDLILGTIVEQAGTVRLTPKKALDFVRARHVAGDPTSDYGRIHRQQVFLSALMREAMSRNVLLDPRKLNGFINAFAANTRGDNLGVDQLLELAQSLQGLDAGRVTFITVPTVGYANQRGNEELRVEDTTALFRSVIDGVQLPGELPPTEPPAAGEPTGSTEPPAATSPPGEVKLQVLNGAGRDGLAGQTTLRLTELGFDVVKVDNAQQQSTQTVIRYSASRQAQARTLAAAVPKATLKLDPSMGTAIELLLGTDFDDVIRAADSDPSDPGTEDPAEEDSGLPDNLSTVNAADDSCA